MISLETIMITDFFGKSLNFKLMKSNFIALYYRLSGFNNKN
jgi:hypothetical protein